MNPLIKEAELLKEQDGWQPSGYVQFKRALTKGKIDGDFVVITLAFWGVKELVELYDWAEGHGLTGFDRDTFDAIDVLDVQRSQEVAPICPIHKVAMLPSQHTDGWYCRKRQNGGYCTKTAKRASSGGVVVV